MKNRHEQKLIAPELATTTFKEVALGFDEATAVAEAERCLNCKAKPCVKGCPVGIDIPGFIQELKNKNYINAYTIIKKYSSFPAICGRVCPQENQCEKFCVRNRSGGAVAIGLLERFVADWIYEHEDIKVEKIKQNGKSVAVVGSGPAGLACACELAIKGFEVVIYEALQNL